MRPRIPPRWCVTLLSVALLGSACGSAAGGQPQSLVGSPASTGGASPRSVVVDEAGGTGSAPDLDSPPPFRVSYPGHELRLRPHAWCYVKNCVDGVAPTPPSVGAPGELKVYVPVAGWELHVTFTAVGARCGRQQSVDPARASGGAFLVEPAGPAALYDVDLFAQGRSGDMTARLRWSTPTDGPRAVPSARLAVIAGAIGQWTSYGVELAVDDLAEPPRSVRAQVTVAAADGRSLGFDATPADTAAGQCRPPGSLYFDGPDDQGLAAARLGAAPFTYTVLLTLDGVRYRAVTRYPDDVIAGNEPSVALMFTPPLPGLG